MRVRIGRVSVGGTRIFWPERFHLGVAASFEKGEAISCTIYLGFWWLGVFLWAPVL